MYVEFDYNNFCNYNDLSFDYNILREDQEHWSTIEIQRQIFREGPVPGGQN